MKAHQRLVRERAAIEDLRQGMFGAWWEEIDTAIERAELCEVDLRTAARIIKQYEYLGTMCNAPIRAFGIRWDGQLGGVVVFGAPSPPIVATSVAGKDWAKRIIQLGRGACVHWAHPHAASRLIGYSLRKMGEAGYVAAIAFADPAAGEIGTVYQATNWLYCGLTAKRPDYIDATGKRMVGHFAVEGLTRTVRQLKGRYVFPLGDKRQRRRFRAALRWPILPYPKR